MRWNWRGLTRHQKLSIAELYDRGLCRQEIAIRLNIATARVKRILNLFKRNGMPFHKMKHPVISCGSVSIITVLDKGHPVDVLIDSEDLPDIIIEFSSLCIAGKEGYIHGYSRDGILVRLHRFVMKAPVGTEVDHILHDVKDNRKSKLRIISKSKNQHNRIGPNRKNTSGVLNVHWDRESGKWRAKCTIEGKRYSLGRFPTIEQAEIAVAIFRDQHKEYFIPSVSSS